MQAIAQAQAIADGPAIQARCLQCATAEPAPSIGPHGLAALLALLH